MSARAKRIVVGVVLALLVGGAAFAIWRAPALDLVPMAKQFLVDLDEGRGFQALERSQLLDRWDLPGLLENNSVRQRRLGKFVRVESASPLEDSRARAGLGDVRAMRLKVTFERGPGDVRFEFARVGSTWAISDFEFESLQPPPAAVLEQHMRRAAKQLAQDVGQLHWATVHGRLLRADRIAHPMEAWTPTVETQMSGLGTFQSVEERTWSRHADGRATFGARLVFEGATKDVDLDLLFDPTESRVVITRLAFP